MPLIFKDPGDASLDPKKEAYKVQQKINEKFVESVHFVSLVIKANDGDMIDKQSLYELLSNQDRLIELDSNKSLSVGSLKENSYLWNGYDESTSIAFTGVYSIANAVDSALRRNSDFPNGLADANEDDVKLILHQLFPRLLQLIFLFYFLKIYQKIHFFFSSHLHQLQVLVLHLFF